MVAKVSVASRIANVIEPFPVDNIVSSNTASSNTNDLILRTSYNYRAKERK